MTPFDGSGNCPICHKRWVDCTHSFYAASSALHVENERDRQAMTTEELKPCFVPHCYSKLMTCSAQGTHWVHCELCNAAGPRRGTGELATAGWNSIARPQEPEPKVGDSWHTVLCNAPNPYLGLGWGSRIACVASYRGRNEGRLQVVHIRVTERPGEDALVEIVKD